MQAVTIASFQIPPEKLDLAFAESDLPFRVDVLDYYTASESFRKIIGEGHEKIY